MTCFDLLVLIVASVGWMLCLTYAGVCYASLFDSLLVLVFWVAVVWRLVFWLFYWCLFMLL